GSQKPEELLAISSFDVDPETSWRLPCSRRTTPRRRDRRCIRGLCNSGCTLASLRWIRSPSADLLNSALESRCFPNPSARFAEIDLLARLTWSANPNCSILGKASEALWDGERQRIGALKHV